MPNGLWYARGPCTFKEAIPSSAFSKGDILQYDSNSSLSRINLLHTGTNQVAGVACADSINSFNDKVPYIVPETGTVFWSVATANSNFTPGEQFDFDVDAAGRPVAVASQNSAIFVAEEVSNDIEGQSVQSVILGRFILGVSTSTAVQAHVV